MPMPPVSRRTFTRALAIGAAAAALPGGALTAFAQGKKRLKVGHTGITWGYGADKAPEAIKDVAAVGYHAFESFGNILEHWDSRGGLEQFLHEAKLPLVSAYCPTILTDPAKRTEEREKLVRWGKLIKKCGGRIAVIGPDNVKRTEYDFKAARPHIVAALNEYGRALADVGIVAGLHPHTGSCVQTREEVYTVYGETDPRYAKMAPDLGELLHGGADPLEVVRDFLPIIVHAHLKDWGGGQFNNGYCPAGQGKVDLPACVAALEKTDEDIMLMAELNPDPKNPKSPRQLITESRDYLQSIGYAFRS